MRRVSSFLAFSLLAFGLSGSASRPAHAADDKSTIVKLDKLKAPAPAEWTAEKPANRLRSFQFKLKGVDGNGDGELAVMPESTPDPDKAFPRWKGSFVSPEGKTLDDISKTSKQEINGAKIHILDVSGTWKFKERPFDPKSKEELRDNYRVVWVIVVEKDEATHLRLSGPQATVEKYYPGFETWLRGLK